MIHVCFGLYDKDGCYSKFTGTAMLSMFENTTSEVTVHILHDNTLSNDNRDKFIYIAGRYGQQIKFYNVEEICADKIHKIIEMIPAIKNSRVSIGTLFSLLIPDSIPLDVQKIIYLDGDMIINLDINKLWQISIEDKPLASVPECKADDAFFQDSAKRHYLTSQKIVSYENYFNAGIIFMNLKRLRNEQETLINGIKWRAEHPQCICFDQDIWNYCFANDYVHLPVCFDRFVHSDHLETNEIRNFIYHYSGDELLTCDFYYSLNRLWFSYFEKTPWFNKEIIGRLEKSLNKSFNQTIAGLKNFAVQVSALIAGKNRAFFTAAQNVDAVKTFFLVQENEEVIPLVNQESFNELARSMQKSRSKKVFFILVDEYHILREVLKDIGFVEGRDFLNAAMFLPNAEGEKFKTHQLVKAM